MVEQSNVVLDVDNVKGVGGGKDNLVLDGARGRGNVLDTGAHGAVDIVVKGEEGVRGQSDIAELANPLGTLLGGQRSGHLGKLALVELLFGTRGGDLVGDEKVNGVGLVGALGALGPLEGEHAGVLAQPPVVGLVTGKTGAVDTRLLASAETDNHTVLGVADGVGLCVLESNGGHGQVNEGLLGNVLVLRDNLLERRGVDDGVVALLLQGNAVDLAGLNRVGVVVGVDLQNAVLAALLLLQNLQSLGAVAGGNDTVRDLLGDDLGGGQVDNVGKSNPVAKGRHAVGTTGTGVGISKGRKVLNVADKVELLLLLRERDTNSGTGGGDVLEGSSSRESQSSRELLDQGPRVEGIKQVNVTGGAREHLEGELALGDKGLGGLLVGVGAVSKGQHGNVLGVLLAEEVSNHGVVLGGVLKGLESKSVAGLVGDLALLELAHKAGVVIGVGKDGDTGVVLGGGAQKSNTTNIDFLDGLVNGDVDLGDGLLEGVEVANDVVDLVNVLGLEVSLVGLNVAGKNT